VRDLWFGFFFFFLFFFFFFFFCFFCFFFFWVFFFFVFFFGVWVGVFFGVPNKSRFFIRTSSPPSYHIPPPTQRFLTVRLADDFQVFSLFLYEFSLFGRPSVLSLTSSRQPLDESKGSRWIASFLKGDPPLPFLYPFSLQLLHRLFFFQPPLLPSSSRALTPTTSTSRIRLSPPYSTSLYILLRDSMDRSSVLLCRSWAILSYAVKRFPPSLDVPLYR